MSNEFRKKLIEIKLATPKSWAEVSLAENENQYLNNIAELLINNLDILVLDTSPLSPGLATNLGLKTKQLCAEFGTLLFLKGRVDVAFIVQPDCMLLDSENLSLPHAREILGDEILIGYIGEYNNQSKTPDFIINGHGIDNKIPVFKTIQTTNSFKNLVE